MFSFLQYHEILQLYLVIVVDKTIPNILSYPAGKQYFPRSCGIFTTTILTFDKVVQSRLFSMIVNHFHRQLKII